VFVLRAHVEDATSRDQSSTRPNAPSDRAPADLAVLDLRTRRVITRVPGIRTTWYAFAPDQLHILDLFSEDDRLNVYAGELEVRPPEAPSSSSAWRPHPSLHTRGHCETFAQNQDSAIITNRRFGIESTERVSLWISHVT
jgi:hypothetical protein